MLLVVRGFGWGVGMVAVLLFLQMWRRVLDTVSRLDSLFLDILVMPPWFDRGPLVWGRYSFVEGHLKSSIVSVEDDLVLSGRRIACSHSRMGGFVDCLGMGSGERDLSI